MPLSKRVATLYEVDGREFVDVEDFLNCYPDANEKAKKKVWEHLKTFNGDVEKRIEDPLVGRLLNICWPVKYPDTALCAPIVLRDGWVIWVSKGHEPLIDSLGRLFVPRDEPEQSLSEMIAQLSGEAAREPYKPNVDLLTSGHAWYISTTMPQIISTGRMYQPSLADKDIFNTFRVRYID